MGAYNGIATPMRLTGVVEHRYKGEPEQTVYQFTNNKKYVKAFRSLASAAVLNELRRESLAKAIEKKKLIGNHYYSYEKDGFKNPWKVLDEERVYQMRVDRIINGMTLDAIAEKYEVSATTAAKACRGVSWKHVPMPEVK